MINEVNTGCSSCSGCQSAMFCYQCEQTVKGTGCTTMGVCGKDPEVAALQDLMIHELKGIGVLGQKLIERGETLTEKLHKFVMDGLFSTLTNVNFSPARFVELINEAEEHKTELISKFGEEKLPEAALYRAPESRSEMVREGRRLGVFSNPELNEDVRATKELAIYGLKGVAAYAHHAYVLGKSDLEVNNFFYKVLSAAAVDDKDLNFWVNMSLELGRVNFRCMELLSEANSGTYGTPTPTNVVITKKKGPVIVVSGHDLKDLKELLEQTEGKGINIYTHGEMLPAHAYPELKKYPHLVGNYGGAWQDQQKEFDSLPGCILMTTNCIQKPRESYKDRIFTSSVVGWPDVAHIEDAKEGKAKDFSAIIEKALSLGGWTEDEEEKTIMVGFGHSAVLSHADKIIEGVKSGAIKHFFLIGGCDGAKPGRNYYTDLATSLPKDTIILTLACGKYRFNKLDFGNIGELPRLLDVGQCNDAYSAVKIALALAEAFNCGVNDLPLSLILSWYEQKAVCILLSLLALGIKNIKLGPSLPAFISPNVLKVLVENFGIKPISTPEEDIKEILG